MRDEPDTMYGTVPSAAQTEHAADRSATLLRESTPTGTSRRRWRRTGT